MSQRKKSINSEIDWLQTKISFLEQQVASLQKEKKGAGDNKIKKNKSKTKLKNYESFDELVTAFDDSKELSKIIETPDIDGEDISLVSFLKSQLLWNARTGESIQKVNHTLILNFIKTPLREERFMIFALMLCIDVIWYIFSYLILRSLIGILTFVMHFLTFIRNPRGYLMKYRGFTFDFLRLVLILWGCYIISLYDLSYFYHYIRSVSGFKIYLIMNIIGTFDLFFTQIEHNVADALFYSLKGKSFIRFLTDLFFAFIFVAIVCTIKFISFMTFNVVLNTNPQTYIISIVSRKLKFLRKTVGKKYDELNLFDCSCKDLEGRFSFIINVFLSALLLYQTNDLSWEFFKQVLLLYLLDTVVGILKHMILLKQNRWPPEIYSNYTALLKRDYLLTVQQHYNLDPTHVLSERIGFSVIGTSSLMLSVIIPTLIVPYFKTHSLSYSIRMMIVVIIGMCIIKFLLSLCLFSLSKKGISFVDITTVDNEVVAAEQQVGQEKKEVPQMPIESEFSIHHIKKE